MRLVTFTRGSTARPGVLWSDSHVLDLPKALEAMDVSLPSALSVRQILAAGPERLHELADALTALQRSAEPMATEDSPLVPLEHVRLLAPLGEDVLIWCSGRNYHSHTREMRGEKPPRPEGFIKSPPTVTGSGEPIVLPPGHSEMVDFEGELAVVFGKPCYAVSEARALDYVVGYTLINDVSARDWVPVLRGAENLEDALAAWQSNQLGKQFPTFCPMGPVIATRDEVETSAGIRLQTRLNGEVMQDASTTDLVFSIEELIAYFSRFFAFRAGDVLTVGTAAGVGVARNPPVFLRAGDEVAVTVDGIGTLRSPVVAAAD